MRSLLAIATAFLTLLAGCGGDFTGDGRTTVKFASWGATQDQITYTELIRRYELAHPDTHIELMFIPFGNYFTKLQLLLVGGVAPDTITISNNMAYQLKSNGHLVDLQPFVEEERKTNPGFLTEEQFLIEKLLPVCSFDGHIYYIPVGPMCMHLYYNKTLFDEAGDPYPHEGWTWDDFLDAAQKLTREENGRVVQWGFLVNNWIDVWRLFILQNGGDVFDDYVRPERCTVNSPEAVEAIQFLQDLIYKYHVSPSPVQATQNVSTDFMTGRLAMTIHGTWMVEQYRNIKQFEWDMGPLPMRKRYANIVSSGGYGMTSQCKDPKKAWEFLKNFLSDDTQRLMSTDVALWQPTLRSAALDGHMDLIPGVPEHHNLRFTEIERSVPSVALHHPQAARIMDMLTQELDPIFLGKESAKTCLDRVAAKIDALLQSKGPVQ